MCPALGSSTSRNGGWRLTSRKISYIFLKTRDRSLLLAILTAARSSGRARTHCRSRNSSRRKAGSRTTLSTTFTTNQTSSDRPKTARAMTTLESERTIVIATSSFYRCPSWCAHSLAICSRCTHNYTQPTTHDLFLPERSVRPLNNHPILSSSSGSIICLCHTSDVVIVRAWMNMICTPGISLIRLPKILSRTSPQKRFFAFIRFKYNKRLSLVKCSFVIAETFLQLALN